MHPSLADLTKDFYVCILLPTGSTRTKLENVC
jgi:hypothetical protein